MWRKAKNVRITYKILPGELLDDTVESVPTQKSWMPQPREIKGVDTPDGEGAWAWRGRGLLKVASSRWEVLGWGREGGEVGCYVVCAEFVYAGWGGCLFESERGD